MVVVREVAPANDDIAPLHVPWELRSDLAKADGAKFFLVERPSEAFTNDRELDDAVVAADIVAELPEAAGKRRGHERPPSFSMVRGSTISPATAAAATTYAPAR